MFALNSGLHKSVRVASAGVPPRRLKRREFQTRCFRCSDHPQRYKKELYRMSSTLLLCSSSHWPTEYLGEEGWV